MRLHSAFPPLRHFPFIRLSLIVEPPFPLRCPPRWPPSALITLHAFLALSSAACHSSINFCSNVDRSDCFLLFLILFHRLPPTILPLAWGGLFLMCIVLLPWPPLQHPIIPAAAFCQSAARCQFRSQYLQASRYHFRALRPLSAPNSSDSVTRRLALLLGFFFAGISTLVGLGKHSAPQ